MSCRTWHYFSSIISNNLFLKWLLFLITDNSDVLRKVKCMILCIFTIPEILRLHMYVQIFELICSSCEISQFSSINFFVWYYRKILMNTLKLEGIWYFRNIKEINDDIFLRPHYFCPFFFFPLSFHIFSKVNLGIVKSERNVSAKTLDCYEKKNAWGYELKSL